jgi:hypothetical protein
MRRALGGLAAAVALAGCGSGGAGQANRYVDSVNRAQARFVRDVSGLSGRVTSSSDPRDDTKVIRGFDNAVARVTSDLRAIDPPAKVSALHRRLVAAIGSYGREIRREASVLRSGDPRALVAAQQRLLSATTTVSRRINTTIAAINRKLKGS